jgi:hypothetical protein
MSSFKGQLNENQISQIAAYLKSLPARPRPRRSDGISSGSNPESYLSFRHGAWSWLFTSDHKRVAVLYLITISWFFPFALVNALVLRVERPEPRWDPAAA